MCIQFGVTICYEDFYAILEGEWIKSSLNLCILCLSIAYLLFIFYLQ